MDKDAWKVIIFAFCCIPFAIWKWIEIIIWLVKHILITLN